jgi:hypothetical protein
MAKDVKVFVQNCLHCVATVLGEKVPRPLGTQLHAIKPNELFIDKAEQEDADASLH